MPKKKATTPKAFKTKPNLVVKKAAAKPKVTTKKGSQKFNDCEPLPTRDTTTHVRVMEPSPDVLFARAKYALIEIMPTIQNDGRVKFVDIGHKYRRGKRQSDIAIRLHVTEKSDSNPIRKDCCSGMVRTDVIVSEFTEAVSQTHSGDGITSGGGDGTLSMGVRMPGLPNDSQWMLMTCAHVISAGLPTIGTRIRDTNTNALIGRLTSTDQEYYEFSDDLDVAIFVSVPTTPASERGNFGNLQIRPHTIADPTADDVANNVVVYKLGAKTQETFGIIDSRKPIFRDIPLSGKLAKDHFLVASVDPARPFAEQGDSGAAVVTVDGRLIGIVRGVTTTSSDGPRAVITPMSRIAGRFRFDVQGT